jgi:hypothetical protein
MKNEGQMNGPRITAHRKVRVTANRLRAGGLGTRASFCRVETAAQVASPFRQRARQKAQIFAKTLRIMKTTTLQLTNSVRRSHVRLVFLLIPLACFALSPQARATCQHACLSNQNTVLGDDALLNNTTGIDNTAIGFSALLNSVNGFYNTAVGSRALLSNTSGAQNTAIGDVALQNNTTGNFNTATGVALESNTTGIGNTATGLFTLKANTTGSYNTAIGFQALKANTIGSENIALGSDAGLKLVQGSNNIYIGNRGDVRESNTIRIGNPVDQTATFIAGISGAPLQEAWV